MIKKYAGKHPYQGNRPPHKGGKGKSIFDKRSTPWQSIPYAA